MLERIQNLLKRVKMKVLGTSFSFLIEKDKKSGDRIYIQLVYGAVDSRTKQFGVFKSRKWYLSEHMTDDEIIKTAYLALETAVKHEILEGFKIDGHSIFNPHINFEELLKISDKEIIRTQ